MHPRRPARATPIDFTPQTDHRSNATMATTGIAEQVRAKVRGIEGSINSVELTWFESWRSLTTRPFVRCQCLIDLEATHVDVVDFTDDHCSGAKIELTVVSAKFEGVPLIKRHRMVNDCLKDLMAQIHALTMKTWTPEQFESKS